MDKPATVSKRSWKKIALFTALGLVVVLAGLAGLAWWFFSQPMYASGDVRSGKNLRGPLTPPAQSGEAGTWQVEPDVKLHYFTAGSGSPVLVVHGGPGFPSRGPFPGFKPLEDRFQFYYYDQRGCGRSTRLFDRFTSPNYFQNMTTLERSLGLGAQIADIERIRKILGQERIILVGHSWGGFLAALYAAEFPERIARLVLIAPAATLRMPIPGPDIFAAVEQRLPASQKAAFKAWYKSYFDFNGLFKYSEADLAARQAAFVPFYSAAYPVWPAMRELKTEEMGGWMVYAMYVSMGLRHDYRPGLAAVKAPALVLHGSLDLQPESASRMYVQALPNARLEVIPGSGHFPQIEKPSEFASALGRFL